MPQRPASPLLLVACLALAALSACSAKEGAPGTPGAAGAATLVSVVAEPPGANCAAGGTRIVTGLDANRNGTLDPAEATAAGTSYVCNAVARSPVVRTTAEPAGAHCTAGGIKVETGLDANANGLLDAAEVDAAATTYVCNGAAGGTGGTGSDGLGALVRTAAEPAGASCAFGGTRIETGLDADRDGTLDDAEVNAAATTYACNGAAGGTGGSGSDGLGALVRTVAEPAGASCAAGGLKVETGLDADRDGTLDAAEVDAAATTYVCNGGTGGTGAPGASALLRTSPEPAGAHCAAGGAKVETGLDANANGLLDDAEVNAAATAYVCNGAAGGTGGSGSDGLGALVRTAAEPAGADCAFGGTRIETGLDTDRDGTLDDAEVNAAATSFVCALGPGGAISPSTGLHVLLGAGDVSTAPGAPITVRFRLKDDRGFPVDLAGAYSVNTPIQPRFALASYAIDPATGLVSPLSALTQATSASAPAGQPTAYNPLGAAVGQGTLVENGRGAGDYTYTFPVASTPNGAVAVAYDPARVDQNHVLWIQATRQTDLAFATNANTFFAANQSLTFIPSGQGTPVRREVVSQAACARCHAGFKAETVTSAAFHGGGRVDAGMCGVCHNPGRTTNPLADASSFIHRIHAGQRVASANLFHGIAATYPQDLRRCDACHGGAAQGGQALTHPTILACQGCHDYVSFTGAAPQECFVGGSLQLGADGKPLPCNHAGGIQTDGACATCHGPAGFPSVAQAHVPVIRPNTANIWQGGGTNANTNASYVAAGGVVPAGADVITYDVRSVDAVTDTVVPGVLRPQITFKLKRNGTDVVFQAFQAGVVTELMPNFVGSPSAYFAFAVPQDGIAAPADFNASASGYLKKIWDASATGTGAGTLTGPDASGYYTLRLTGVQIPATATLLTGGLGYTYSLTSAPPLVQTNLPRFPWTPAQPADGRAQGGLSVPAPNVWKVATGYTARRAIVDNEKCKACHGALGVAPTFHAGQRNDGPTCSFCHNPNRTSSGWSAGSKYFIHAIHAGRKRTVPYTWHATEAGPGYDEVEFPGTLNGCTTCHVAGTYDFTAASNLAAVANMPPTTVATGIYDANPLTNSSYYTLSPYVVADGVTSYGAGFSFNAATNVTNPAAGTTLVLSPITGACAACHDSGIALDHMEASGGRFYVPRSTALAPGAAQEQCLLCHGPGRVAAIGEVHQR